MMTLTGMAARSAWNRRYNLLLMIVAIALSTALLLGVERLRHQVRAGFAQSISGTDLIVGARTSPVQLTLSTVFHLGGVTHGMSWASAQRIAAHPLVAWTIPVSLGDSHRGFPVLATSEDYFRYFHYGDRRPLALANGRPFGAVFETVLGAEVARRLGYRVGDRIVLSHGGPAHDDHHADHVDHVDHMDHMDHADHADHADKPFVVTGILAPTGTPVDRTVHIRLDGMEAIHLDWQAGAPVPGMSIPPALVGKFRLTPAHITGVLVGLKLRSRVFALQREIDEDPHEALMAVLPGVALDALWQIVGVGEKSLLGMSALIGVVGLAGLVSSILAALGERRRELAILRAVGARPIDLLILLATEGFVLMLAGTLAGYLLLTGLSLAGAPWLEARLGVALPVAWPRPSELPLLAGILAAGAIASLLPGWRAYRLSLSDGLTPHI
ncbi:ABC transporter permease [Cupriavidus campinensis]|uniref:ABC transporter permease n=1 Tax=Cupriavidus campinensis TaxID=151783 RepID=UPI001CA409E1|nr:ABC transporter permease [Cupriavidus campinensis]